MPNELDQVIHQPIRTKILALLLNSGKCDYSTIKSTLDLTDGHMSTHMKVLTAEQYVEVEKSFVDNKPKTTYKVTKFGKKKFAEYIESLKEIISIK
ncbi:MAG: transcriptional regulator [Oligoflexia bacterium]|nr:transcriptional regulator [Oligoflexia bacterium]